MDDWQDILGAPMDGTPFLAFIPEYAGYKDNPYVMNVYRGGAGEWMLSGVVGGQLRGEPSHWMPLPEYPTLG